MKKSKEYKVNKESIATLLAIVALIALTIVFIPLSFNVTAEDYATYADDVILDETDVPTLAEPFVVESYLIKYKSAPGGVDDQYVVDTKIFEAGQPIIKTGEESVITPPSDMGNAHIDYWYIEGGDKDAQFIFNTPADRDLTLVAHWSDSYWVYFESAGTAVDSQLVERGKTAFAPDAPSRVGFDFAGWTLTPPAGQTFEFSTPITGEITLTAKWTGRSDTPYTIVIWLEKPNFEGAPTPGNIGDYHYVASFGATGTAGTTTAYTGLSSLPAAVQNLFASTGGNTSALKYAALQSVDNREIKGNGSTVVNVYAMRKVYTYSFPFPAGNNSWYMTIDGDKDTDGNLNKYGSGATYPVYSFRAKYEQNVSAKWPSGYGVTHVLSGSDRYLHWGSNTEMNQIVESTNLMSKRTVIDSSLLPANGSNASALTFTMQTTNAAPVEFRYFVELMPGETAATPTITYGTGANQKTYVEMEIYRQIMNDGTYAKRINGLKPVNDNNPGLYNLNGTAYVQSSSGSIRIFFYDRNVFDLTFIDNLPDGVGGPVTGMPGNRLNIMNGAPVGAAPAANPALAGHVFKGWYRDADGNEPFDFAMTMPNSNVAVFAKWTPVDYIVTYYGALNIKADKINVPGNPQPIGKGQQVAFAEAPYTQGQVVPGKGEFETWYIRVGNSWGKWPESRPVTGDLELFAGFKTDGFTLTYNVAPGSGAPVDADVYWLGRLTRLAYDVGITPPAGKVLIGWNAWYNGISVSDAAVIHFPGNYYPIQGNTTMTAVYADIASAIRIVYHSNYPDAAHREDVVSYWVLADTDENIRLKGEIFTLSNAGLTGWKTAADGITANYSLGQAIAAPSGELHLYGHWRTDAYSITFTVSGAGGVLRDSDNSSADTIKYSLINGGTLWTVAVTRGVPEPVPAAGFIFKGWRQNSASGELVTLPLDNVTRVWQNFLYVAAFEEKEKEDDNEEVSPNPPPVIITIESPNVPSPLPSSEPEEPVELETPNVPLEEFPEPEEPIEIKDPETPIGSFPKTGVTTIYNILFIIGAVIAAAGLAIKLFLQLPSRKK